MIYADMYTIQSKSLDILICTMKNIVVKIKHMNLSLFYGNRGFMHINGRSRGESSDETYNKSNNDLTKYGLVILSV